MKRESIEKMLRTRAANQNDELPGTDAGAREIPAPRLVQFKCCRAFGLPNTHHVCDPPRDGGNE